MAQMEISIPAQPLRVTLHRARVLRDQLEKRLAAERPNLVNEITAIALRFHNAETIYHSYRPIFYRKRTLDQLRVLALFVSALETKATTKKGK